MQKLDLFHSKYKMSFEDFWRKFYDSQIFDFSAILTNSVKVLSYSSPVEYFVNSAQFQFHSDAFLVFSLWVHRVFPKIEKIDLTVLSREIVAFRMELFGKEWISQLEETPYYSEHDISKNDRFAEMSFAKIYLEQKGRSDIWDTMLEYNENIAANITFSKSPWEREMILDGLGKERKTELEYTFLTIYINRFGGIEQLEWEVERLVIMLANRLGLDKEIDSETSRLLEILIRDIHLDICHLFYNVVTINPNRHEVISKSRYEKQKSYIGYIIVVIWIILFILYVLGS